MKKVTAGRNNDQLIPGFSLPSTQGGALLGPANYKQQSNLVLVFFQSWACDHCRLLLRALKAQTGAYRELDTRVLGIAAVPLAELMGAGAELGAELPLLADEDGSVRAAYAGSQADGSHLLIVIADRFGAFFASFELEPQEEIDLAEIESTLSFIETMCPECGNFRGDTLP